MSDIPEMMHKPRESDAANEAVGGGLEEVQSSESGQVPLNLHYPTTGVDHKSLWTADNFWRLAPVTTSMMFMGGPEGARRGAGAMWKLFQWLKGSKAPPPAVGNAPRIGGSMHSGQAAKVPEFGSADERLESLLMNVASDRYRVMATHERTLIESLASGEGLPKHAQTLMPFGNFSKLIENPITHEADKISISTTYTVDGIFMIVKGDKGALIQKFELSYLGEPLKREIDLMTRYFRSEFNVPPVRMAKPPLTAPESTASVNASRLGYEHRPAGGTAATSVVQEVQHGESTVNIWNRLTDKSEALACSWQVGPESILARAIGPQGQEILEIVPLNLRGKIAEIEKILMNAYALRYF